MGKRTLKPAAPAPDVDEDLDLDDEESGRDLTAAPDDEDDDEEDAWYLPDTSTLSCLYCGCTEDDACVTPAGPCSWITTEPPVCSNPSCIERNSFVRTAGEPENDVEQEQPPRTDLADLKPEPLGIAANLPGAPVIDALIVEISVDEIARDPKQARDEGADAELADSIRANGVLQPIVLRRHPEAGKLEPVLCSLYPSYLIVDGERRWLGARAAKLSTIPARIVDDAGDEGDRLLRQNLLNDGKRLKPMEEARSWKRIMTAKGWKIQQLATALGRPKSTVSDRLALLDAPKQFLPFFERGVLSAAAAPVVRQLLDVPARAMDRIVEDLTEDWEWEDALRDFDRDGKPIALDKFERMVDDALTNQMALIDPKLEVDYKGKTVQVGSRLFAVDVAAYTAAAEKADKPSATKRPAPSEAEKKQADAERKRRSQQSATKERAKLEKEKKAQLHRAQFAAVASKLPSAIDGKFALILIERIAEHLWLKDEDFALLGIPVGKSRQLARREIALYAEKLDTKNRIQLLLKLAIYDDVPPFRAADDFVAKGAAALKIDLKKVKPIAFAPEFPAGDAAAKTSAKLKSSAKATKPSPKKRR